MSGRPLSPAARQLRVMPLGRVRSKVSIVMGLVS